MTAALYLQITGEAGLVSSPLKMSWPLAADAHLRGLCASRAARSC
jgi:hypothetical protein